MTSPARNSAAGRSSAPWTVVLLLLAIGQPSGAAAPATIVILPPHVKGGDAKTRAAAELLCDRLAMEGTKAGAVKAAKAGAVFQVIAPSAHRSLLTK